METVGRGESGRGNDKMRAGPFYSGEWHSASQAWSRVFTLTHVQRRQSSRPPPTQPGAKQVANPAGTVRLLPSFTIIGSTGVGVHSQSWAATRKRPGVPLEAWRPPRFNLQSKRGARSGEPLQKKVPTF